MKEIMTVQVQVIAGCAPALCSRLVCSGVLLGRVFFLLGFSCAGGVRPAAHLSLSSLASVAGSEIFANVASDAIDRAQVSPSYQYYVRDSGAEMTVTYTANTGYYISQITVNNLDLPISASVASAATFVNTGSYSYRCYRSDNQVIIILTNITANLNIIGIVIPAPVTVNIDGSANYGAHSVNIDFDAVTGNATVSVNLSGRYPYSVALGSNSPQLINRWNDTVYQTSDAFAVTYQTNNYSTKIKFYVVEIDGQIVINLVTTNVQPPLEQGGGTSISGVALQVSASGGSTDLAAVGEARITGYNQTEGLTTVHVSAVASRGYAFVGWQVDGETISTLLSADIPYDDVEGKILVAVFEPINQNINDETDNNQTNDFDIV